MINLLLEVQCLGWVTGSGHGLVSLQIVGFTS